jgi:hypothetical protein
VWGDEFKLKIDSKSDTIIVRVWDKNRLTNGCSFIGMTLVNVRSLIDELSGELKSETIPIMFNQKNAGSIKVKTKWEPKSG